MHDAIIVLAHLMDRDGTLNAETAARLERACELLKAGRAPILVPCGWAYRDDSDICIADAMAAHAIREFGIDASQIITETMSRDTVGDAVFTKRNLANPRGWKSIAVVTSRYHAHRTREIFSFVYGRRIEVLHAPIDDNAEIYAAEVRSKEAFYSTFSGITAGDDDAIFQRLRERHPFYNGDVHPKLGGGT